MSFKFIKTRDQKNSHDHRSLEFTVDNDDIKLADLIRVFEDFLRGCGYSVEWDSLVCEEKYARKTEKCPEF